MDFHPRAPSNIEGESGPLPSAQPLPRFIRRFAFALVLLFVLSSGRLAADTLRFTNGDHLTGKLLRADANQVVFDSPVLGTITVAWSKIQSLQTDHAFVVVSKGKPTERGQIQADSKQILVRSQAPGDAVPLPHTETSLVVPPDVYAHDVAAEMHLWQGWKGAIASGLSLVNATQSSRSYTGSLQLDRPVPGVAWLPNRADTQVAFQGTYGKVSQPGQPTILTNILTFSLEQDRYVHDSIFTFGRAELNHNLAQGLDLQQSYGAGIGWKWLHTANSELDLKADLHYTRQAFLSTPSDRFLASSYSENWLRKFHNAMIWTEMLSVTPSYTQGLAYQMAGTTSLVVPLYKLISLNTTLIDSYIGNPQPGYKKNSLQFSSGIQFSFQP